MIIQSIKNLIKPNYDTLNRIEIKADAILRNLEILQSQQDQAKIIPVLKANAYGHGLKEICLILNRSKAKILAVDSFPEAQIAYRYFKGKVLLIGEMPSRAYNYINWSRTELVIYNSSTLRDVFAINKNARIHLFINSGMNREGIKDLSSFWHENKDILLKMRISGVCSHLASAEDDGKMNDLQLNKFFKDVDFLKRQGVDPDYVHIANSAATFIVKDRRLTAFRPGLSLYGYNPFNADSIHFSAADKLSPALRLVSRVVSLQDVRAGESVSYNQSYQAQSDMKVAVIPFGYYEGLDRSLSNKICFTYKDRPIPLLGNVCMNLSCVDVSQVREEIKLGSEITLISSNKQAPNSIYSLAKSQKALVYEVLVRLQANIRRNII